jgi:hypothetical protein
MAVPVLLSLRPVNLQTITNISFRSNFGPGSEYVNPLAFPATAATCGQACIYKTVEWGTCSEPQLQSLHEASDDRSNVT